VCNSHQAPHSANIFDSTRPARSHNRIQNADEIVIRHAPASRRAVAFPLTGRAHTTHRALKLEAVCGARAFVHSPFGETDDIDANASPSTQQKQCEHARKQLCFFDNHRNGAHWPAVPVRAWA
jgi:hypothetical protein